MAENPIRLGIIGCDKIARKVARAINLGPNSLLYAVGSRSIDKASVSSSVKAPLNISPTKEAVDEEDFDSAGVLRHLHKEVNDFVPQHGDRMNTTDVVESLSPATGRDRNFELVASTLQEVLAVISE
ncbi:hypothetical protein Q3G72_020164 [Acer saccharum]|nr:hypothetical protein Q3G72_020164 [Acer saccharum]